MNDSSISSKTIPSYNGAQTMWCQTLIKTKCSVVFQSQFLNRTHDHGPSSLCGAFLLIGRSEEHWFAHPTLMRKELASNRHLLKHSC